MSYAALLSLSQTLDQILVLDPYPLLFNKQTLVSLHTNVVTLLMFLEDYSHKFNGVLNPLESRIIDVAYNAEDIIEYHVVDVRESMFSRYFLSRSCIGNMIKLCVSICWLEVRRNVASLEKVLLQIDLILEEVIKIKRNWNDLGERNDFYVPPSLSVGDTDSIVFQDDYVVLSERIFDNSCSFDVIPIVGMGGIGKSTLARSLYDDSVKTRNFDRYVWIVVSQGYSSRRILSEMLVSMGKHTSEEYSDSKLEQLVYQELFNRRYLVVIDDLWSANAWDDLNLLFPKDTNSIGSKVLVTTRLFDVACYVGSSFSPPHEIRLLNEQQSWKLLEVRVFGEGNSCPCELVQIGKKVAKLCRGLPLTIVVIAGLLKVKGTKEYWESISENISSSEPTVALHCSKVLSLSYNHLPLYLKPCFLYVTSFFEDEQIKANRLVRLWVAEGFVKQNESKSLEQVAEGYLNDLVGRSLLMALKKNRYNNRIKTIRIHDVLRDFGASNAQEERLFHFLDDVRREYRRVTISRVSFTNTGDSLHRLSGFRKPAIRSVLIPYYSWDGNSIENLSLLRVWNASGTGCVPNPIKLIHTIRYLSISHVHEYRLLETFSQFRKIQTLIIGEVGKIEGFNVPLRIWKMSSLRHLILPSSCELEQPFENETIEETSLQTLRSISNLRLTSKVLEMLISLRDFNVIYDGLEDLKGHVNYYHLNNLVRLQNLEKLRILFSPGSVGFLEFDFPTGLKKLSITNIDGSWEDIGVVGTLPYLEVFKLKNLNSNGVWIPVEGEFLKLKHLELESVDLDYWEAESEHFPSLEILVLKNMRGLKEIPNGIGEIDTLEVIELLNGETSLVDSAKQIQVEQRNLGNEDLQVVEFVTQSTFATTSRR